MTTKIYSLLIALLLGLVPVFASAQTENVSVSVSATVLGEIEITTINTMDFRNIGGESSIVNINPIQSARAGKMVGGGQPEAQFRIDYVQERELNNIDGDGTVFFNYSVAVNRIDEQDTAELIQPDYRDFEFNEDGEFFIWIGGTIDLSLATPGTYEGEFSIEIEYI